ncbi:crotonase/enoyl-CoA hydratase family protein [Pseudonocardia ailaonensis]|uniref:Crotonase/enoyl-CoA hydratase family protein n=1 Tax=Pseudonocardia ailaonensis TaxID=367279 RepID=A0ABN2N3V2_9PSEU
MTGTVPAGSSLVLDSVSYDVRDHVATITLSRPERLNAFTDATESDLVSCFEQAAADDEVRVVVLTAEGRAFCAGMHLAEAATATEVFAGWRTSPTAPPGTVFEGVPGEELPVRLDGGGRVALSMWDCPKPVIAAVNGPAVGVGATMLLPADIRLAADTATFAMPFTRLGLSPESCSSWFLPRLVGPQQALEWLLTGRRFGAAEALAAGLVRSLHPPDELLDAARVLAAEIAAAAPVSVAVTRRLVWRMLAAAHPVQAHRAETLALNRRGVGADARDGIPAFLEKRAAVFTDRVGEVLPSLTEGLPAEPERGRPGAGTSS